MACVAEAFKESITIDDVLAEVGYENINMTLIEKYSEEVSSENCIKVLKKCVDNLNSIGVKLTAVNIELIDNPEVQCCQPE